MSWWVQKLDQAQLGEAPVWFQYPFNLGVSLSQTLSVILGGDPDETVSSRCGKAQKNGGYLFVFIVAPVIDWLLQEPDHCIKSIEPDEGAKEVWHWSNNWEDHHGPNKRNFD